VPTDYVEAARSELATWLTGQLHDAGFVGINVLDQWPAPSRKLELPVIAVLAVGEMDRDPHSPMLHSVTELTGVQGLVTYSYGRITLGFQLDVWGSTPRERSALTKAVSDATNVNPIYSLNLTNALPDYRRAPGLVLRLNDFYGVLCSYRFEQEAVPEEDSDSAQTMEFRAMFSGESLLHAANVEQVALLKRIHLSRFVNGGTTPDETVITG